MGFAAVICVAAAVICVAAVIPAAVLPWFVEVLKGDVNVDRTGESLARENVEQRPEEDLRARGARGTEHITHAASRTSGAAALLVFGVLSGCPLCGRPGRA